MTKHAYIDGTAENPGHVYFEQDGARLRCELEPEDVITALDAHMEAEAEAEAVECGKAPHGPGLCTESPDDYLGCYSARTAFHDQFDADHPGAWDRNDWCVSAAVEVRKGNCDE